MKTLMRCIYFDGKLNYREDYEKPLKKENEALIRVKYAGICNTDKEIIKGYKGFKGILGHEFIGIVEEANDNGLIGKRVTGDINIGCGVCHLCRQGRAKHCKSRKVLGILGKNGAFAEYITLPLSNIHIVPDGVSDLEAVFAEPLAAALEITEIYHIKPTDKVAIIGYGKLGKLISQVIRLIGCDLTIILRMPKDTGSIDDTFNFTYQDDLKYEDYYDVVIECTGNSQGLKVAQRIVKATGAIILKSTYSDMALLDPTEWVVKEINLIGTRCGPIDAALRLLDRKLIKVDSLIGGIYYLKDYEQAFNDESGLKSIFKIQEGED